MSINDQCRVCLRYNLKRSSRKEHCGRLELSPAILKRTMLALIGSSSSNQLQNMTREAKATVKQPARFGITSTPSDSP